MTRSTDQIAETERQPLLLRRRGAAIVLALLVEGLIALVLLTMMPLIAPKEKSKRVIFGFDVAAGDEQAQDAKPEDKAEQRSKGSPEEKPPAPTPPQPEVATPEPPAEIEFPPGFIRMSRQEFAASDVGKMERQPRAANDAGERGGQGGDSELAAGRGPRGEKLYAAEWHQRPTQAQLGGYIPPRAPRPGWGLIACRTVADFRVEDCQVLGESPVGSGWGRAVSQAAWQFRVRPPRVGGKLMVGEWVAIRIDYTLEKAR